MARRYFQSPLPESGAVELPADLAHHLGRVMRVRSGDSIVLFDGDGRESTGRVVEAGGRRLVAEFAAPREVCREPKSRIWLGFPLPKGARADWLFEHGTEVGVGVFCPLVTERTGPAGRRDRPDRWTRITRAAAGQCDRSRVPEIREPVPLEDWLASELPAERYVAATGAAELGPAVAASTALLVGPEGGLTETEMRRVEAADFARRGLGALTLRVETAALVGVGRLLG